jgi:hypothetical protein
MPRLVEAVPGSPLDIFTDRPSPAEHLRRLRALDPARAAAYLQQVAAAR